MVGLVPVGVVWVQRVRHVRRQQEGGLQAALHGALPPPAQRARHPLHRVQEHGTPRALRGGAANLLVVEQRQHAHAGLPRQRAGGARAAGHQAIQPQERAAQVVQTADKHKFPVRAWKTQGLGTAREGICWAGP